MHRYSLGICRDWAGGEARRGFLEKTPSEAEFEAGRIPWEHLLRNKMGGWSAGCWLLGRRRKVGMAGVVRRECDLAPSAPRPVSAVWLRSLLPDPGVCFSITSKTGQSILKQLKCVSLQFLGWKSSTGVKGLRYCYLARWYPFLGLLEEWDLFPGLFGLLTNFGHCGCENIFLLVSASQGLFLTSRGHPRPWFSLLPLLALRDLFPWAAEHPCHSVASHWPALLYSSSTFRSQTNDLVATRGTPNFKVPNFNSPKVPFGYLMQHIHRF